MTTLTERTAPPRTWRDPGTHFLKAMESHWYRGVLRLQDALTSATVRFWTARGVCFGHLPITTGSVSSPMGLGSDSRPVRVELHGVPTFLADSMQFSLEYLCRLNDAGAYYVMPSFRGEPADATHLSEFFHSEAEIPGGLDDVIRLVEEYVRHLAQHLLDREGAVIAAMAGGTGHVEAMLKRDAAFTRLTFDEAAGLVGDEPGHVHTDESGRWRTLTRAGEQTLMDRVGQFLWITEWDHFAVPFYQAYDSTGTRALNADLLFGPGEVVGAGERHATGENVREALRAHGVDEAEYGWYVAMKDAVPLRTAGFGLGVERFLMWLTGNDDIRDFQIMPRRVGETIVP
jgi:aspartyl/asparaginyl-tRNA synthetase